MSWKRRPGDVSERVAARQLKYLIEKYNGICQYCFKKTPPGQATREHKIRLVDGGTSDLSNLTLACKKCNNDENNDLEMRLRIAENIRNTIARQASGLPVTVGSSSGNSKLVADTWSILIEKGIKGTIRRQQLGIILVSGAPSSVECLGRLSGRRNNIASS